MAKSVKKTTKSDVEIVHYADSPRPHTALCGADVTGIGSWFRQTEHADRPMDDSHTMCLDCIEAFEG